MLIYSWGQEPGSHFPVAFLAMDTKPHIYRLNRAPLCATDHSLSIPTGSSAVLPIHRRNGGSRRRSQAQDTSGSRLTGFEQSLQPEDLSGTLPPGDCHIYKCPFCFVVIMLQGPCFVGASAEASIALIGIRKRLFWKLSKKKM